MKTDARNLFEREETLLRLISRHVRVVGGAQAGGDTAGREACHCCECAGSEDNDYVRLPGLFRRWEFQDVVDAEADFNIEAAGLAEDGTELFSVYRRQHGSTHCLREG
ncbi:hypothetical protein KRR26_36480 [Corallococcus sp. M34]|uniref:hypothetical protein n=1 Tax=Citreicoccus inhibens TaxID=2849499 RepID=UPI001C22082F|nr:hypothetical protein [Citreicoccus inhibens]MBU8901088.1 hypothetical protein [Citreicoccus inhibens]